MDTSSNNILHIDLFQADLDRILALRKQYNVDDINNFCQIYVEEITEYVSGQPETATHRVDLVIFGEDYDKDIHIPIEEV